MEASASSPECFEIEIQDGSVQQQIDAIGPSGTIRLKEGVYRGTVKIDKSLNLIGAGSSRTVMDGDSKGTVITVGGFNRPINVTLAGMTVRRGLDGHGGGIWIFGNLTIEGADIIGNNGTCSGGGIDNYEGSLRI